MSKGRSNAEGHRAGSVGVGDASRLAAELERATNALLASRRWKIGNAIGDAWARLRRQDTTHAPVDDIKNALDAIRHWQTRADNSETDVVAPSPDSSPMVGVGDLRGTLIVCVHNAPESVEKCLSALAKNTNLRRHQLVIIDDGSDAEARDLVLRWQVTLGARVLRNEEARGYTRAANQGLVMAREDFAVLLNSDAVVTPGWLERLVLCAFSDATTAIAGPLSNAASWQSIPRQLAEDGAWAVNETPGLEDLDAYAARIAASSPRLYPKVHFLNGFCYLIKTDAIRRVGVLDEETFPRGYGEEDDFSLRCAKDGLVARVADDCFVYHYKSKSFGAARRLELVKQAKGKLEGKHGPAVQNSVRAMQRNEDLLRARVCARLAANSRLLAAPEIKRPLTVAWLQPHLLPCGGVRRAIETMNRLQAWGHRTTLITPEGAPPDWLQSYAACRSVADARGDSFDVVMVSDPQCLDDFNTIRGPTRVVFHLAAYMLYRPDDATLRAFYAAATRGGHIANSSWTAEQVQEFAGISIDTIIPGGVDPTLFYPRSVSVDFDVVCSGATRKTKGSDLVKAATVNRSVCRQLQQNLSQEDLAASYCRGRVYLSASRGEGFNLSALEAMASGVPVVMTDDGGSRDYARADYNAAVVQERDGRALSAALDRVMGDPELRLRFIENGLETASEFTWDASARKLARYLNSL